VIPGEDTQGQIKPGFHIIVRIDPKICSGDRDDHVETRVTRRGTIGAIAIVWIEMKSIRTIAAIVKYGSHSQTIRAIRISPIIHHFSPEFNALE